MDHNAGTVTIDCRGRRATEDGASETFLVEDCVVVTRSKQTERADEKCIQDVMKAYTYT